jgi:beta-glucosidase
VEQLEDRCVPAVYGGPQVVFVGDSITARYQSAPVWAATFGQLGAADVGTPGNTTAFLQSQLDRGLLAGTSPRLVVLMIGFNDLWQGESPGQTAAGVAGCVAAIRASQPQAQILLLGVLPSGQQPGTPLRQEIAMTNALLSGLDDHSTVHFMDIGSVFLQPDGTISAAVMPDYLHPSALGYVLETDALAQPVLALLTGARSVSVTSGPLGEGTQAVSPDGTLTQLDASVGGVLGGGARNTGVTVGPLGGVFDAFGEALLSVSPPIPGALSAG